ncbi:MAG TPA: hybrid sensor histidine kinase/response regulator [Aggregatilineales bacterium]|nr:hybrid sensor histidine kinase/response regulator [Aggregatilineales bacterium]
MSDKPTATILYIEDDPASRSLVERTLKFAGYRVLVAERGLEGIDLARRERPDLILTDINLPDISGRDVTATLRADDRFDNTPIVALTAQTMDEFRTLALGAGVNGYLTKPIDIEALADNVKRYLEGARDTVDESALAAAKEQYVGDVVTRLEQQVRDLQTMNENLLRLDKMKDTFIQVTAHELRTPLTLVFGYSRLIEEAPDIKSLISADDNLATLMKGLQDSIKRMQNIINEILTVSRIITNQIDLSITTISPGHLMETTISNFADGLKQRRLTMNMDPIGWPERIRADGELLAMVFSNLLSNAIKYTPDGGQITITANQQDPNCIIRIQDTGIGIAPSDLVKIFESFHTTGDYMLHSTSKTAFRGGGIGLGLAVVRGVAEAHGGSIRAESSGHNLDNPPGSTFILTLPLIAQPRRARKLV